MKTDDAELYVGFPDPVAVRKPLLEAAKTAVATGGSQGKLQHIQDKKLAVRTDLARVLKELKDEFTHLQMLLPHREIKEPAPAPAPVTAAVKKKLDHHVDKIEAALAEIEERMKSL